MIIKEREVDVSLLDDLEEVIGNRTVARLYAARGIDAEQYAFKKKLEHPETMGDFQKAVDIIAQAMQDHKKIAIVGDYDVDGATSTTIAMRFFRAYGVDVFYLIPSRFKQGYGLSAELVDTAKEQGADVIITVDNGIVAFQAVDYAKSLGLTVIVTDHHTPHKENGVTVLPHADAVVNPVAHGEFPYPQTCGAGVIFYVMHGVHRALEQQGKAAPVSWTELIQLVGLATVCDMVPLHYNNRLFIKEALKHMRTHPLPGIRALTEVSGAQCAQIREDTLGFYIGPRINAAGRLQDMHIGVETLLSEDFQSAAELAHNLQSLNSHRKSIEHHMLQDALDDLDNDNQWKNKKGIVVYRDEWNEGVVGLVASRIKERYYKPAIALCKTDSGFVKGSARSIEGLYIRESLAEVSSRRPDIIHKFGGHAMAAGLTIHADKVQDFMDVWESVLEEMWEPHWSQKEIGIDGEWGPAWHTMEVVEFLENSGPWGVGCPSPLFICHIEVEKYIVMKERHSKVVGRVAKSLNVEAVKFGWTLDLPPKYLTCTVTPKINEWRGGKEIQLMIQDIIDVE